MEGVGCLLIDLQDCFLKAMPDRESLEKRSMFVLEACKLLGIKTYFSEQIPEKLGDTSECYKSIIPEAPFYAKRSFSAWAIEDLKEQLKQDGVTHLLIGGIETSICVYQTTIQARADDMSVTLLSDCVSCRRKEDEQAIFRTLLDHETLILPSETVFYSILGDVDHPKFREFTKLVKQYNS